MPKIPTFTSQQQMTTESSSVVSDLKIFIRYILLYK